MKKDKFCAYLEKILLTNPEEYTEPRTVQRLNGWDLKVRYDNQQNLFCLEGKYSCPTEVYTTKYFRVWAKSMVELTKLAYWHMDY